MLEYRIVPRKTQWFISKEVVCKDVQLPVVVLAFQSSFPPLSL